MKLKTTSINNFVLKWRFTDKNYSLLAPEDLSKIRPLEKESASIVWRQSIKLSSEGNYPSLNNAEYIECADHQSVQKWLQSKLQGEEIIVSWDSEVAVITTPSMVSRYWDDFCYPASDDVTIWSENKQWVVCYSHDEKFWYGTLK